MVNKNQFNVINCEESVGSVRDEDGSTESYPSIKSIKVRKAPTGYQFCGSDGRHRFSVAKKYNLDLLVYINQDPAPVQALILSPLQRLLIVLREKRMNHHQIVLGNNTDSHRYHAFSINKIHNQTLSPKRSYMKKEGNIL